jgi:GNAT superfamily N-acetyltransferase
VAAGAISESRTGEREAPVKLRPWDTDFFGLRIGSADLEHESLDVAVREAERQRLECLYVFTPSRQLPEMMRLTRRGARLVTLRQTLTRQASTAGTDNGAVEGMPDVRRASSDDAHTLHELAEQLAPFSRFASDPRFDHTRIAAMYRAWSDQCLADGVVTVARNGAGFVGITLNPDEAHVSLVYVNGASAGRGLGRALLESALGATDRPAVVATDAGNVPALRMYEHAGFRTASTTAIFHLWLDELRADPVSTEDA